jgi:hypothetical protein
MKKITLCASIFLALAVSIQSCKKETLYQPPIPTNSMPVVGNPSDANGVFKASVMHTSTKSVYGNVTNYQVGSAYAFLTDSFFSKLGIGDMYVQDVYLYKQSDNTYSDVKNGNVPQGVSYPTDEVNWYASGDTNSKVDSFFLVDNTKFPAVPVIVDQSIKTQQNFLLSAKDSVLADSTLFVITGPNGKLSKTKGPNAKSCAFSAEELATLGTGRGLGLVQISPYNSVSDTTRLVGKKIYFIKQTIASKYIDLE